LAFTIKRQGSTNVELYKTDANNLKNVFAENFFDVIIADLPCSAE
jgi:16S rRNA C967 or C1407 C5-methylase (RsmB/RsmF family)